METFDAASPEDLVAVLTDTDGVDPEFDPTTVREAYRVWTAFRAEVASNARLIVLPAWFARKEFDDATTPLLVGSVAYDDADKGAVLFDTLHTIDTNICVNEAFDIVELEETVRELDVSDEDDYIDESGKDWLPRNLATMVRYREPEPDDSITNIGTP